MKKESVRVIIDTNVWISFLIGKRLSKMQFQIANSKFTIVVCEQLLTELKIVTA